MDPVTELTQAADGLSRIAREVVETGSAAARQAILDTVRNRRGTLSVSGLGATLDVATSTTSSGESSASASLRAQPAGAWALVGKGAKRHTQRRRRGMPTPYGVFSKVNHPGIAGLAVSGPARVAADRAAAEAVRAAVDRLPRH